MGSLALPRATRFETTTRFTGPAPDDTPAHLTVVHQYGSRPRFQRNETEFGPSRGGTPPLHSAKHDENIGSLSLSIGTCRFRERVIRSNHARVGAPSSTRRASHSRTSRGSA